MSGILIAQFWREKKSLKMAKESAKHTLVEYNGAKRFAEAHDCAKKKRGFIRDKYVAEIIKINDDSFGRSPLPSLTDCHFDIFVKHTNIHHSTSSSW